MRKKQSIWLFRVWCMPMLGRRKKEICHVAVERDGRDCRFFPWSAVKTSFGRLPLSVLGGRRPHPQTFPALAAQTCGGLSSRNKPPSRSLSDNTSRYSARLVQLAQNLPIRFRLEPGESREQLRLLLNVRSSPVLQLRRRRPFRDKTFGPGRWRPPCKVSKMFKSRADSLGPKIRECPCILACSCVNRDMRFDLSTPVF